MKRRLKADCEEIFTAEALEDAELEIRISELRLRVLRVPPRCNLRALLDKKQF
jgi:hypothetical protein